MIKFYHNLGFDLREMGLPFEFPAAAIESQLNRENVESWRIGFFDIGKQPVIIDPAEDISIRIASPAWQDGCVETVSSPGASEGCAVMGSSPIASSSSSGTRCTRT